MIDAPMQMALQFHRFSEHLQANDRSDASLARVAHHAAETLPRCDWASIVRLAHRAPPETLAASSPVAAELDQLQADAECGPVWDAAGTAELVAVADLTVETRWPAFIEAALAQTPARSVVAFPVGDRPTTVLLAYGSESAGLAAHDVEVGALFATLTRIHLLHVEAVRKSLNLVEALNTSRHIGTAVGILMLARKLTADDAFDLLRDASQRLHVKLREVAHYVLETGELPAVPAPRRGSVTPLDIAG